MGLGLWLALLAAVVVALWVDNRSFPSRRHLGHLPRETPEGVPAGARPAGTAPEVEPAFDGLRHDADPPGFREGELGATDPISAPQSPPVTPDPHPLRRALASTALTFALWLGVFASLLGGEPPSAEQIASVGLGPLVFVPVLMLGTALLWGILTDGGRERRLLSGPEPRPNPGASGSRRQATGWPSALGLTTQQPGRELVVGLGAGFAAWATVLAVAMVAAAVALVLGLEELVPQQPASIIAGLASLPVAWRLAISVAAGVGEEIFFRGLLQPRIGLLASTALFALGHVGYGQPFLLLGVTVLSLIYGLLARWRGNVWAAVVAHTLFDAVQLLVIIPLGIEASGEVSAFVAWGFIW